MKKLVVIMLMAIISITAAACGSDDSDWSVNIDFEEGCKYEDYIDILIQLL